MTAYDQRRKRSELRTIRRRRWLLAFAFFVGAFLFGGALALLEVLTRL